MSAWRAPLAIAVIFFLHDGASAQPTGAYLAGEGPCKVYVDSFFFNDFKSFRWTGPCKDGVADGLGELEVTMNRGSRLVWRHLRQAGRQKDTVEERLAWRVGDRLTLQWKTDGRREEEALAVDQLPGWARRFLLAGRPYPNKVIAAGPCKVEASKQADWREVRWNGPCRKGWAHGIGVLEIVYPSGTRGAWRQARENGVWKDSKEEQMIFGYGEKYTRAGFRDGKQEEAPLRRDEVPSWARQFLFAAAQPSPPPEGTELVDAGSCRMYLRRHEGLVSANWRGGCAGGMAGGLADGDGLLEFVNRNNRVIRKVTMRQGREQGQGETYAVNDSGGFAGYSVAEKAWKPLPREHLPQWARHFLDAHRGAVAVVQAAPPAPPAPAPAQASAAQEARIAEIRRREEEEEAQRRHEEEREERRRRREEREEEERAERDRNNRYMEAMGAIMKGAAEGRRQAEERRRAQVAEIERQNERYRQQRSAEDRRWVEEQQRQRAQEAERQRAQEAQRQQVARAEQARAQPRWQRVNLPAHTGCISVQWRPSAPQNVDQWYEIRNGCPMTLNVHWCARQGCTESTSMATIAGGGSTKSWTLKKYGPSVSVIIACQVDNGGRTVHFDRRNGQCWSDVQMQ